LGDVSRNRKPIGKYIIGRKRLDKALVPVNPMGFIFLTYDGVTPLLTTCFLRMCMCRVKAQGGGTFSK
jgi:hypothetical protein